MSNDEVVDAGLDELTDDALGPRTDAVAESNTVADEPEASAEPEQISPAPTTQASTTAAQPQAQADAAQPQPTPAAPEATIEIDGRTYTQSQLRQTLLQFPHLQKLWADAKPKLDAIEREQAQRQQPPIQPAQVLQNIRASFDGEVQKAVSEGFVEEEFALLYPNLSASMMLIRDSQRAANQMIQDMSGKIAWYERQNEVQGVRSEIDNNMLTLSTQHPALAPLATAEGREEFFQFLIHTNADTRLVRTDPDYLVAQYVAHKKNDYLNGVGKQQADTQAAIDTRAAAKRRAQGAPLPGSRPTAQPQAPATPLDELVDDFFSRNS